MVDKVYLPEFELRMKETIQVANATFTQTVKGHDAIKRL